MTFQQKIKMVLAHEGISESELARRLGTSPQAFNQRMRTGKFSFDDLERIAEAINAKLSISFTFDNGESV